MISTARGGGKTNSFINQGFKSKAEAKPIMSEFLKMQSFIRFEGFQEVMDRLFPVFTDKKTGTTFLVKKSEKLYDVWKAIRNQWENK